MQLTACNAPGNEVVEPAIINPVEITPAENPPVNAPFLITQAMLDSVTVTVSASDTAITGNRFGVRTDGSDRNIKDIYTNKPLNRTVQAGDIIVIRSFQNIDGRKGPLDFVDIMVRREIGYNTSGADFEYFRMDFDPATNYSQHPNGMVPLLTNSLDRGMDIDRAGCLACHRFAPGGDFLFTDR